MKNVSSMKSAAKIDSPKTPGGISKSLLTPCRRVGLSRKWRKNGPSPFVSPLAGSTEEKLDKKEDAPTKRDTRKRKVRCDDEELRTKNDTTESTPTSNRVHEDVDESELESDKVPQSDDLETTPSRNVSNPRKKKPKTLLSPKTVSKDIDDTKSQNTNNNFGVTEEFDMNKKDSDTKDTCIKTYVNTPVRSKSLSKVKSSIEAKHPKVIEEKEKVNSNINNGPDKELQEVLKQRSPDNLTKECIVVIQKKIYKKDLEKLKQKVTVDKHDTTPVSQALFDSDTDDVPLSALNNKEVNSKVKLDTLDEDDDFAEKTKIKVKKLEDKSTSIGGLKSDISKKRTKPKKDLLSSKKATKPVEVMDSKHSSQSSVDDDEDFVIDNKRTILIRKSYDKVTKPSKAKSTGSITQKDIDELKARIEMKKKLLLAKAVSEDTEELRDLIRKWQKGCQDALMELMVLMKNKFPDKQNMDYSEILQTLKIPASLVGYDEDNDCFSTPTDENIILSKFNDT